MKEEQKRLDYTLGYVEKGISRAVERKSMLDEKLSTGLGLAEDSSQRYLEKLLDTMFQETTDVRLRNLLAARKKPYFARIDFTEAEKAEREKIYIGKMALIKEENQDVLIVDWRAPIANLYYEGRLGDAAYQCPDGNIQGQLQLKRQITINEGKLHSYSDIDITTNDDFLQASLGANADNRLKEIVSTIQEEQNQVIRAEMWTPLIVQGAAGSGKTTIALHRMAYLIYTFEKSFVPESFMIIAPNKLFLNYISDILPELGVERALQSTFEDFANKIIGQTLKLVSPNEKIDQFATKVEKPLWESSELKCSMIFKDILDEYIETIEMNYIPKENLQMLDVDVFSYKEINRLFLTEYKRYPIVKRLNELKKHMNSSTTAKKVKLIELIEIKTDQKIIKLKQEEDNEGRQEKIIRAIDKKNQLIEAINKEGKTLVKEYLKKISKIDPVEYYEEFIKDDKNKELFLKRGVEKDTVDLLFCRTREHMKKHVLELEDLAPIIYLKFKIHGIDEKIEVKHIIIDEAQDFSVFQLYCLKQIIKESSFTILGDLSQGIHAYRGIQSWQDVISGVFENSRVKLLTLEQTYRTTVEIAEAANQVIAVLKDPRLTPSKPVIRHGKPVKITEQEDKEKLVAEIDEKLNEMEKNGYQSFAIICKTVEDCKALYGYMEHKNIYMITGNEKEYKGGAVIVPAYLAKGLEFDVVFIVDVSKGKYDINELDVKLLYVAMTRALHELYINYAVEKSHIIKDFV